MSWFDQGNKISERDLIAYHLHELPPRREREVARALEHSASLTAVSASVEATLRAVKDTPKPIDQAAFTRTWAVLQLQLNPYAIPVPAKPHWQTPVFAKAALAGLAAMGLGVMAVRMYRPSSNVPAPAAPSVIGSATASPTAPPEAGNMPSLASTSTFHDRPRLGLPDSRPRQSDAPLTHILTPYPTLSAPQVATSEPPPQKLAEPTNSPLTPPAEISADKTSQSAEIGLKKGKTKAHGTELPATSHGTDLMLALGGTLIPTHSFVVATNQPHSITATAAIGGMGTLHQQFRPALGYRVALSYTKPDFQYSTGGNIDSRIFEAAGTYVIQGPHHGRWSTSADAGAALMAFLPVNDPAASYAYRPAGVLGASADFALSKHWAARATYRAQVFRVPDFRYTGGSFPVAASVVISHEPWFGIVYRFGKAVSRPTKP